MRGILEKFETWVDNTTGLSPELQQKVLATVFTVAVLWAVRRLVLRIVARRTQERAASYYHWRKGSAYVTYVLAVLLIGRVWVESFASLATVIGLISAGLAVALKDPLVNLAGWLYIIWRKPIELGDRIEIGEFRGDVVDQGAFTFSLIEVGNWVNADDRTGRLLLAPNGLVFTAVLANYSKGWFEHIWNELTVVVTFESDWRDAKRLLADIATQRGAKPSEDVKERMKRRVAEYMVLQTSLDPRVFTSIVDVGVALTVRYLCRPDERRRSAEAIWEDILDAFHERDDIDFAYPTVRYYDNIVEGKPEARAKPLAPASPASKLRARLEERH